MAGTADLAAGDALGRYRLEALLGEGATGIVFRALREPDGALVALKVLKGGLAADEVYRRRFLREARVASEVRHPHLVPVFEAGEVEGRYYLASRYLEGRSLAQRLAAEGALPLDDVLRLAAELAAGLDALHRVGIVHRDVKPSNVILDHEDNAVLTDFGLAKGSAYTVLTKPGQLLGTPDYLAPELIRGEEARAVSDIYALGCLVFACIAGRPPFASENPFQVTVGHLGVDPPDPCSARADAPAALGPAVLLALAKEPAGRPRTARSYALALWCAGRATPAPPPGRSTT